MYRKPHVNQLTFEDFVLPFGGQLRSANRWVILAKQIPWADRELVEQIAENPYLQYFLGLTAYQAETPFHHSLLTAFRKRFTHDSLREINEAIVQLIAEAQLTKDAPTNNVLVNAKREDEPAPPKGQLLLDATCVPADIK